MPYKIIIGHHCKWDIQPVYGPGRRRARGINYRLYKILFKRGIGYSFPRIVPVGISEQAIGNAVVGNQLAETGGLQTQLHTVSLGVALEIGPYGEVQVLKLVVVQFRTGLYGHDICVGVRIDKREAGQHGRGGRLEVGFLPYYREGPRQWLAFHSASIGTAVRGRIEGVGARGESLADYIAVLAYRKDRNCESGPGRSPRWIPKSDLPVRRPRSSPDKGNQGR